MQRSRSEEHTPSLQFPGRDGWCAFRAASNKLSVIPRVPPGVARLSPPWSPFEAGASFLGRTPHSPETSGGGPRHSSVLEDVCLVVASLSLGHAEGQRPLRHQASRRAVLLEDRRLVATLTRSKTIVADRNLMSRRVVVDACCYVQCQKQAGKVDEHGELPREITCSQPRPHTSTVVARKSWGMTTEREGRNHIRHSEVKLSNLSPAEPMYVFH